MRKETKNKVLEVLAKMAIATASKEADSACFYLDINLRCQIN